MRTLFLSAILATLPGLALAGDGPDPSFGEGGFASFGFQPVAGDTADHAFAACAGPNGTLNVVGSASNDRRLVVLRLLANGARDPSFGVDGARSIDVYGQQGYATAAAACAPDGDIVVARTVTTAGEDNIQVLRVDANSGALDPSFDGDGLFAIDLDTLRGGLAQQERPLGVDLGDNGDLLVTGFARIDASTTASFLLRITPAGTLDTFAFFDGDPGTRSLASGAYDGSSSQTWIVGARSAPVAGAFLTTLSRNVRVASGVDVLVPIADPFFTVSRVRAAAPGVLVAGVARGAAANSLQPALAVFRAEGAELLALPGTQPLDGAATSVGTLPQLMHLAPLGNREMLVTANLSRAGVPSGFYATRVAFGASAAADRIDTSFGNAGSLQFSRGPAAGCATRPEQYASRLTLWREQPVLVGTNVGSCAPFETDYLVVRLGAVPMFRDGFD